MSDSFEIKAGARQYTVDIDAGSAMAFLQAQNRNAIVICDAFFSEQLKNLHCPVLSVTASESNKTLDEGARLIDAARAVGLTRHGYVIAVGGGIVQDVACFVASVYMRGIAWSYLPTTILGMVDSCIGGKSSINVGRYKNLAGTIHPPELVLVDTDFANTLPMEHRAGGLCEAAKIVFARGGAVFDQYMALGPDATTDAAGLARIAAMSLRAKRWFIEIDEFDRKERLTLNFGHTFGHAIESATDFTINHGAAVGLGMLCAVEFALQSGLSVRDKQIDLIEGHTLNLLYAVPRLQHKFAAINMEAFAGALLSDKKHTPDSLTLVLPVDGNTMRLHLCKFPRTSETLSQISRAVEYVQRKLVG